PPAKKSDEEAMTEGTRPELPPMQMENGENPEGMQMQEPPAKKSDEEAMTEGTRPELPPMQMENGEKPEGMQMQEPPAKKSDEEAMAEGTRPKLPQNQIEENDFSVDEKLGDLHDELTADTSVTKDDFVSKVKKVFMEFLRYFRSERTLSE
ncbi:MAG: hypothetical protein IKR11_03785, partial [Solobacterium sp.]|nr:hypothetical protein [Solobacterium sp.]